MKYPKHHTQTSRQVEVEVMSLRSEEDLLYIPPMVILGPSPTIHSYVFTKEVSSLLSADFIKSSEELDADAKNFTSATPQHLVNYLGLFYTRNWKTNWLPHALKDSSNNFKVQKRPFTFNPNIMVDPSSKISATVSFQNILCRYEEFGTSGASRALLVSALMESGVDAQVRRDLGGRFSHTLQQKLFSVEGKWDPISGELCMVGCGAYSTHRANISTNLDDLTMLKSSKNMNAEVLSKLSSSGCNWKICIHSVLRKYVTVDSPRGAIVSSLHEPGHPDHFEPIRIQNFDTELTPTETGYPTEYRYTRSSQAIDLAKMSFNMSTADANENAGLVFPAPPRMVGEADMMCTTYSLLVRDLTINRQFVLQKHGSAVFGISFSHLESCAWRQEDMWGVDWSLVDEIKGKYPPQTYVKVAVSFFMSDFNQDRELDDPMYYYQVYKMWDPQLQVAEGVYDPHTGEMHLLATVLPGDRGLNLTLPRIGGKGVEVEDREIYLRIQYPPQHPNIALMQNYEAKISIESLRKVTDPLYFGPLEFQILRYMYASDVSPMIDKAHWGDVEDVLMQTVILLSVMRQITYGRRNAELSTPYLSTVMLGMQALCYLIRSLSFGLSDYQFAYSFINFHEFQIANKALSLVCALLLLVLVQQVYESRLRLRVRSRSTNILHPPPACESKTFELFVVTFGVVFISSLLNAWVGYKTIGDFNSNPEVWLPGLDNSEPGWYMWWGIGFEIFSNSVQHLYLLPQVIANVLCDLRVKPLGIFFILAPSLVYMGSNLRKLYSGFQLLRGPAYQLSAAPPAVSWAMSSADVASNATFASNSSFVSTFVSSRALGFGEAVIVVGDLAITLIVCLLAVVALLQQQRGGRLGWFPCTEEADQNIIESNDNHVLIADLEKLAHGPDAHPNFGGNYL